MRLFALMMAFVSTPALAAKPLPSAGGADLQAQLDELRAEVDLLWQTVPTAGHVFTRWGSQEALPQTTVVETGFGYAMRGTDHLPEGAVGDFMLIDRDPRLEPSSGWFLKGVLLLPGAYPGNAHFGYAEWDQEYMPYLPGVKLVSDTPVTTLWDRHTAPEGWEVLYTGVAYAGYEWIAAPICVDFEVQNATVLGSVMNFNFVTSQGVYGYDDTGAFVATDCVVVRKRP